MGAEDWSALRLPPYKDDLQPYYAAQLACRRMAIPARTFQLLAAEGVIPRVWRDISCADGHNPRPTVRANRAPPQFHWRACVERR